jgi:hypothetical protein
MRKSFLVIIFSLFWLVSYAQPIELPQVKNGNLEFHLVTDENVEIMVFFDNKRAIVAQFLKKQEGYDLGIATHKVYQFDLGPGKHTLRAETKPGKQSFTAEFELSNKRRWVILYYADPKRTKQKLNLF